MMKNAKVLFFSKSEKNVCRILKNEKKIKNTPLMDV